jgi:hypothetical protein
MSPSCLRPLFVQIRKHNRTCLERSFRVSSRKILLTVWGAWLCEKTKRKRNEKNGKRREDHRANTERSSCCIPSRIILLAIMCALNAANLLARFRNLETCAIIPLAGYRLIRHKRRPARLNPYFCGLHKMQLTKLQGGWFHVAADALVLSRGPKICSCC